MGAVAWLDRKLYPDFGRNWDDRLFREAILKEIDGGKTVLDVGAGAGIVADMNFRGLAKKVCGIDLDPRVLDNPMLDEGKVSNAGEIPYGDAIFDVVFADNVVEHLDDPVAVFSEVARVLKPGGVFLFKTPNRSHYMPLISRLTPHAFHRFFNRKRGRDAADTFPTHYRANSRASVRRVAAASGLTVDDIRLIEGRPEYLRFSAPTYLAGALYERAVNSAGFLSRFRILLVAKLSKPA